MDSTEVKREQSNTDILAISAKVTTATSSLTSNWANAIRLTNFTGTIYTDGKVQGSADQAEINQSGTKNKEEGTKTEEKDSIAVQQSSENESSTRVKKKESDSHKESKGWVIPWWVWLLALVALVFLLKGLYESFKSKFKLF